MTDQIHEIAAARQSGTAGGPAVVEGDLVIAWNEDEPVLYGGPGDGHFERLICPAGTAAPVLRCDPERVAPAGAPIAARDDRVTAVQCPRAEVPCGVAGRWRLTLPGVEHPSWHRTKRDAVAAGLRKLAILDWHAARATR